MKKLKAFFLVLAGVMLVWLGAKTVRSISVVDEITELRTDHFVILYHGIYAEEAQRTAINLEENYGRITRDLNDEGHDTIHVFIHPTQSDFNKSTGLLNSTANGTSRGPNEFHLIWTNWYNSIFPDDPIKTAIHEFTHCVQLNILIKDAQRSWTGSSEDFDRYFEDKFIKEYPQWFWEAICDYEAGMVNKWSVKYALRKKLSLKDLNSSNQIYNLGYTIIEYIVEKWGREKLPELIVSYADIPMVLNISESQFEKEWMDFAREKY